METSDYPWSALGIERTADASAIRRAYAVALKSTRPDEDPEAFQRLLTARNEALSWARSQSADGEPPVAADFKKQSGDSVVVDANDRAPSPNVEQHDVEQDLYLSLHVALQRVDKAFEDGSDVVSAYRDVFDIAENAPLRFTRQFRAFVIRHIADGLANRQPLAVGEAMLAGPDWILGPYEQVLIELDLRFEIFVDERQLFDYFRPEAAMQFAYLVALATGRGPAGAATRKRPPLYVDDIFIEAAFGSSKRMLRICEIAKQKGRFPLRLDPFALVLPYFFALYHRMYMLAAVVGGPPLLYLALVAKHEHRLAVPVGPTLFLIYLLQCVWIGFYAHELRVYQLRKWVERLMKQKKPLSAALLEIAELGQPSGRNIWVGFVFWVMFVKTINTAAYGPQP
jgi:hypothetical protein